MKQLGKRILVPVLMVIVSLTTAGLLGELFIRLTIKDKVVLFPRYHTDVDYGTYTIRRFRPNSSFTHTSVDGQWRFEINSQGFRDTDDYRYDKRENTVRVLALGDSHTAGYEADQDQTYAALLETLLLEKGLEAEVLNTGISGFGTAEQLAFLKDEGLQYRPDFVVLGFYGNDIQDNVKAGLYSVDDGQLTVEKTRHLPGIRVQNLLYDIAVIRWLSENSYFFSLSFNAVYELAKKALQRTAREDAVTEYAIPVGRFSDYEYTLAEALIAELYNVCVTNDAKLIILDIPTPDDSTNVESSIPKRLRTAFDANSDALIDSTIALRIMIDKGLPVHVRHGHRHISQHTHRALAEALATNVLLLLAAADSGAKAATPDES